MSLSTNKRTKSAKVIASKDDGSSGDETETATVTSLPANPSKKRLRRLAVSDLNEDEDLTESAEDSSVEDPNDDYNDDHRDNKDEEEKEETKKSTKRVKRNNDTSAKPANGKLQSFKSKTEEVEVSEQKKPSRKPRAPSSSAVSKTKKRKTQASSSGCEESMLSSSVSSSNGLLSSSSCFPKNSIVFTTAQWESFQNGVLNQVRDAMIAGLSHHRSFPPGTSIWHPHPSNMGGANLLVPSPRTAGSRSSAKPQKKKKKDPLVLLMPDGLVLKKPLTAYFLWQNAERKTVENEGKKISVQQLGIKWKQLSEEEKKVWKDRVDEECKIYDQKRGLGTQVLTSELESRRLSLLSQAPASAPAAENTLICTETSAPDVDASSADGSTSI